MDCMNFNESLKLKLLVSGHSVNNAGDIRSSGRKTAGAHPKTNSDQERRRRRGEGGGSRDHPQEEHRGLWLAGGGYMTQAKLGKTQRDGFVIQTFQCIFTKCLNHSDPFCISIYFNNLIYFTSSPPRF